MEEVIRRELGALEGLLADTRTEPIKLQYATIQILTDDFSEDHMIGRGGFGVVYLGNIEEDEFIDKVAVKKLNSATPNFNDEQFVKEVQCLSRVKHKNIVQFLGYCADTRGEIMELPDGRHALVDAQRQRLLCFEYAPNGSLDKFIKGDFQAMDWTIRYRIIKGICQGLQYLHEKRINHLDLKPENVLLDNDMEPKITDFGLSRCFDEAQTRMNTKNICGTLGYLAPEFVVGGEISFKSDIYSLGVIISKLTKGCSNPGPDYSNISDEDWQHMMKCVEELAESCVDDDQDKRPTIDEILRKLDEIDTRIAMVICVDGTSIVQIRNPIREPLHVHPRKLLCPMAANKSTSFSLHLTNKSNDDHFAFMFLDSGTTTMVCQKGVIPPQSTWGIVLHLQPQAGEQGVPDMQGKNKILVRSTIVEKGFPSGDITVDMFKRHAYVHDIELEVVFEEPTRPQPFQISEFDHKLQLDANEGTSHATTQTCPGSIRTELLDIYPFELRYPRKPQKFCLRTIHLTNTTEDTVQFWMVPSAEARYYEIQDLKKKTSSEVSSCQTGYVPPQCTYAVSWSLISEIYEPTNTESFEILMVTRTELGALGTGKGYPVHFAEQVLSAARETGGKAHRACLFVDNNGAPDKVNHHRFDLCTFTKSFGEITSMDVHPTQPLVLTGHEKFVCIWRTMKRQNYHAAENARGFMDAMDFVVKFIARMQWVLSGDKTGKVNVYTTKLKLLNTFTAHGGQVRSFAVHPSHPYVLSSSDDLLIKLWDWDNAWTCTREFQGHFNPVTQVLFNPNNTNSFASLSGLSPHGPGNVKIWSINSSDPETDLYGGFRAVGWSPPSVKHGQYLVALANAGYTEIWDMDKERCVHAIRYFNGGNNTQVVCHPTLPIIVTVSESGAASILNLNTYRLEYTMPGSKGKGSTLAGFGFSNIEGYKSLLVLRRGNELFPVVIDLETLLASQHRPLLPE